MKTVVENSTKSSKYIFDDNKVVTLEDTRIVVGKDPVELYVGDLNKGNSTLYEKVTNTPSDWVGCKYLFDGTTWSKDSNWVDPED